MSSPSPTSGLSPSLAAMLEMESDVNFTYTIVLLVANALTLIAKPKPARWQLLICTAGAGTIYCGPNVLVKSSSGIQLNAQTQILNITFDLWGPIVQLPWYAVTTDVGDQLTIIETIINK